MEFLNDLKSRWNLRTPGSRAGADSNWSRLENDRHVLVVQLDRSGLIQVANGAFAAHRDSEPGDVPGTSFHYLVHAEDRSRVSELLRGVFESGESITVLARLLTSRERVMTIHWVLLPTTNDAGEVGSVLCIGTDLTPDLGRFAKQEKALQELEILREQVVELEKGKERLRRKLEQQATAATYANDTGPIPGLEESSEGGPPTLAQLERRYIIHTLRKTRGRVSGAKGAAAILGLHPNTLRSRMEKLGVTKMAL